jgi:hypothetical protein
MFCAENKYTIKSESKLSYENTVYISEEEKDAVADL